MKKYNLSNIIFQSTLPRGERLCSPFFLTSEFTISIHAPTRGATKCAKAIVEAITDFNPRSHEGSDEKLEKVRRIYEISIHAPTRGATIQQYHIAHTVAYFNPRSHEGSDRRGIHSKGGIVMISIHAPTRGATASVIELWSRMYISIHAPTRGATANITNFH